jgi:flagellar hook-basal body complex protein FliE
MTAIVNVGLAKQILAAAEPKLKQSSNKDSDFGAQMKEALGQVAKAQEESGRITKAFEVGEEVDVTKVMLAREKSSLAFEATLQVRNKLLSAYKDIVSMPV